MELEIINKVDEIQKEIREAFFDIPFGNTQFQIDQFIINKESSSRSYRQVGLEINTKLRALNDAKFRRRKLAVEVKIAERNIEQEQDELKRELLAIELEEKFFYISEEDKLIRDAAVELDRLYQHFKSLPKITREEFERGESQYWQKRLLMDAQREIFSMGTIGSGTQQALQQIGLDPAQALLEIKVLNEKQLKSAQERLMIGNGE